MDFLLRVGRFSGLNQEYEVKNRLNRASKYSKDKAKKTIIKFSVKF